jgi:hypothetical protein
MGFLAGSGTSAASHSLSLESQQKVKDEIKQNSASSAWPPNFKERLIHLSSGQLGSIPKGKCLLSPFGRHVHCILGPAFNNNARNGQPRPNEVFNVLGTGSDDVRLTRRRTKCGRWLELQLQLTGPSRLPIVASATALFQTGEQRLLCDRPTMKLRRRR